MGRLDRRYSRSGAPGPARRHWLRWLLIGVLLLGAIGGAAAYYVTMPRPIHNPPPALSKAGRPIADEAYLWRPVAVGGGGFITGLSMDPAGKTRVVRTDVYGAYIWSDALNRWQQLVTSASMPPGDRIQNGIAEGVYEIVVAPSRPDRIYMAVHGRVYRSDDRGTSWQLPNGGANPFPLKFDANGDYRFYGPFMAVDPHNPDLVLLGTPADGLWRSADAGVHWAKVTSVPPVQDGDPAQAGAQNPGHLIWFEPGGGGRVLVMSHGNGMFASSNGGASFARLDASGNPPSRLKAGAFAADGSFYGIDMSSQTIWALRDHSWHDLTQESGVRPRQFAALAVNPHGSQIVVYDQGGYGYQSTDNGATWSYLSHHAETGPGDPPWLRLADQSYFATSQIMFDPVVPNRLWAAAGMGPFYADLPPGKPDTGWISQARGIEELVANDVISTPGNSPLFAGWDFGIHLKDDLNAYSTTYFPRERTLISAQQLDWSGGDPDFIVTNASDARIGCCAEDGDAVLAGYSRDGGRHWRKFGSLPTPPDTQDSDPWRMSFGTIAVAAGDTRNIIWEPAFNKSPFYTTNRGRTWTKVVLPGEIGPRTGSFKEFFYQRKTLAADKVEPNTFYLVHSGEAPNAALQGLWRTQDGGVNWVRLYAGEITPMSNFAAKLRAVPGEAGHLFFVSGTFGDPDTKLRRSINGGANWTAVPDVDHLDDIGFGKAARGASYPTIFISGKVKGDYGIWRSVDDAKSWQKLVDFPVGTLDQVTAIDGDKSVFGRVYLGYKGSGWRYGEPAPCRPGPYRAGDDRYCSLVK